MISLTLIIFALGIVSGLLQSALLFLRRPTTLRLRRRASLWLLIALGFALAIIGELTVGRGMPLVVAAVVLAMVATTVVGVWLLATDKDQTTSA
jgi:dipeptide/tripeptide permease